MKTTASLAALLCLLVAPAVVPAADAKGKTIGFSVFDMQYGFFQQMEKGTRTGVEGAGYKYVLHDQKGDEAQMIAGCQDLINQGVAALIVSPIKPEVMGPIVEAAHKKKIPVVIDDIGGGGSNYDALVVSNNYEGGALAGKYAVDALKGAKSKEVAIIKVDPSHVFAIRRGEGFKAAVEKAGFKVVKELSGHDKAEEGYTVMKDIITSNPNVVAVFAENDPMAAAARRRPRRRESARISWSSASTPIRSRWRPSRREPWSRRCSRCPYEMGKLTAKLADQLIKGEKLNFDDAAKREIYVPVKLVTKANVEEALESAQVGR